MPPQFDQYLGLIFCINFYDTGQHHEPHVHVRNGDDELVLSIKSQKVLAGYLPPKKRKQAESYVRQHQAALDTAWAKAVKGENWTR